MGNEMGNNNSSGLQEENNKSAEAPEKSMQGADHANNVKDENRVVPAAEGKDYIDKETGLASDNPSGAGDPSVEKQKLDGEEQEGTEVHLPIELPKLEVTSNDVDGEESKTELFSLSETSEGITENEETEGHPTAELESSEAGGEIQPPSSSEDFKDLKDHKKLPESNLYENLSLKSDQLLEKEASVGKEADNASVEGDTEQQQETEETLESSLTSTSKENGHLFNLDTMDNLSGFVDFDTNSELEKERDDLPANEIASTEEKLREKEKFKIKYGEDMGCDFNKTKTTATEIPDDVAKACNGELHTEASLIRNDSPKLQAAAISMVESQNFHLEVSESENKYMFVTEETKLIGRMTEYEDNKLDHPTAQSNEESVKDSTTQEANASQFKTMKIGSDEEDNESRTLAETSCDSRVNSNRQDVETKPADKDYSVDVQDKDQMQDSEAHKANTAQSMTMEIVSDQENNESRSAADISCDSRINSDMQNVEKLPTENGCSVDVPDKDRTEASEGNCVDPEGEIVVSPEPGILPAELTVIKCKSAEAYEEHCKNSGETMVVHESGIASSKLAILDCKQDEPTDKKIVEDIKDKTEASAVIVNDTERREDAVQCMSQLNLVEQGEVFPPESAVSLVQCRDQQADIVMASENVHTKNKFLEELKQESGSEFFLTKASAFDFTDSTAETIVSLAESATDKPVQDHTEYTETTPVRVTHAEFLPIQASDQYEPQECVGRFSTESNPDNLNSHVQMRKSPSFGLDLRIEARSEESDHTPLLYQDKAAIENSLSQADISLGNQLMHIKYNQDQLQHEAMPVEEKVITLERSDSEKSRTPFLGFMKEEEEEEESNIVVTSKKRDRNAAGKKGTKELLKSPIKEAASNSPKSKEKHKRRSSLFGTCICCATVIN